MTSAIYLQRDIKKVCGIFSSIVKNSLDKYFDPEILGKKEKEGKFDVQKYVTDVAREVNHITGSFLLEQMQILRIKQNKTYNNE